MIVDLVRNDLSRIAAPAAYAWTNCAACMRFRRGIPADFHRFLRTEEGKTTADVLRSHVSAGIHDGRPKIRAMELIERYEQSKRGLFSGSVGYLLPDGDFDLNVVIRSIFYNAQTGYLNFRVGGAITLLSDPEPNTRGMFVEGRCHCAGFRRKFEGYMSHLAQRFHLALAQLGVTPQKPCIVGFQRRG